MEATKTLARCPTCFHAMWEGSICNHLRNEPVIISTGRYRLIEHNYRGSKELYTCKVCNKYFLQYAYRNQSVCSFLCRVWYKKEYIPLVKSCVICHCDFLTKKNQEKQETCSVFCGGRKAHRTKKLRKAGERGNSLSPVFVEEQEKLKSKELA